MYIHCTGKRARNAQKYPSGFCTAVSRRVRGHLGDDKLLNDGCFGARVPDDDAAVKAELRGPANGDSGKFTDYPAGHVIKDAIEPEAKAKKLSCRGARLFGSLSPRRRRVPRLAIRPSAPGGSM